jgi:hypothetical protein
MTPVIYQGERDANGHCVVRRNGRPFSPRRSLRVRDHSPDGFNWGYGGSGPAQLALALLLDVTGKRDLAVRHYQAFKWHVVATWDPAPTWTMTSQEILTSLLAIIDMRPELEPINGENPTHEDDALFVSALLNAARVAERAP